MDNQSSFDAVLRTSGEHINLLEELHGKPAIATLTEFSGGFFTGRPQPHDHSTLLGTVSRDPRLDRKPLRLRFQHTEAGYALTIKNTGEHKDKYIGLAWRNHFGVTTANIEDAALFSLMDQNNNILTRDSLKAAHTLITLRTATDKYIGRSKRRGSPYTYLAETDENAKITFILSLPEHS
jgi:hypothetical protein